MTALINVEKPEHMSGTRGAREDWAVVTGQPLTLKPATFLHRPSGQYYCHIVGGIAYPTATAQEVKPGALIIMGIQSDPVKYRILEVIESGDVFDLIEKLVDTRKAYGFGEDSRILPNWYGDQDKYQVLIMKASEVLERMHGVTSGLYIRDTLDRHDTQAFPLYVRQILNTLKIARLDVGQDKILTGHLQGLQREDAERGKVDDFPVVGLLGGMIHSLQIEQPWLEDVTGQGTVFNID